MSSKNRNQRQGTPVNLNSELGGAAAELYGDISGARRQTASTATTGLELMYQRILLRISLSRFTWEGLPDSVSRRWLETCLATQALAVFFRDPDTGQFFATQGSPAGNFNMVGDPTEFRCVSANNMKWWEFSAAPADKECVPIWANELRVPDLDIINIYAHTLAETDRTIQINLKNARQPKVVAFPQNSALTMNNFLDQWEKGQGAIKVDADWGAELEEAFKIIDLSQHPELILNTSIMRTRIWGECMTMLGINNAPNSDKKERLVAAEVSGNDDVIETIRETNLESRRVACDQINAMFDLHVSVSYATSMNQQTLKDVGDDGQPVDASDGRKGQVTQ